MTSPFYTRINIFVLLSLFGGSATQADSVDGLCQERQGNVARGIFTTAIDNREPVNRVLMLDNSTSEVYFFTDLRNLQGHTVRHRWEFEGRVMQEKSFDVQATRWRVYSRQELDKEMPGRWTVFIIDEDGCPLKAAIFDYFRQGQDGLESAIVELR